MAGDPGRARARRWLWIGVGAVACLVTTACDPADEDRVATSAASTTTSISTSTSAATDATTTSEADDGTRSSPTTTARTATTSGSTTVASANAKRVEFSELIDNGKDYVGQRIEVVGKAYFLASCPPPGGASQPCVLTGYLAAPDRTDFNESDTNEGVVLASGGTRISCPEPEAVDGGCAGWKNARVYRVVGTVERQVLGGRETTYLQLEVHDKELE